jgi:hypothetical protein
MEKFNALHRSLVVLILSVAFCQAADPSQLRLHPDLGRAVSEMDGKIQAIDIAGGRLTVEDKANQHVTVRIETDTRVMDSLDHVVQLTSLRPGDGVILYYDTRENSALQIDFQSDLSDTLIGTPKAELR